MSLFFIGQYVLRIFVKRSVIQLNIVNFSQLFKLTDHLLSSLI